ncbi:MAG: DUF1592 domain-containing protein [Rubripirellula sp.]
MLPLCLLAAFSLPTAVAADFGRAMKPLLAKYCAECHSGDDANGEVDFDRFGNTTASIDEAFEIWESVAEHLTHRTMPPDDSPQPNDEERQAALDWYQSFVDSVHARPAVLRPRRLSVIEYQNTLHSILGFDLQVAVIEAEQTDAERFLVSKLLPTDPPGASGFKNDTHANPLTTLAWDQYAYLVNVGLDDLFSPPRRQQLEVFTGPLGEDVDITPQHARRMLRRFLPKAYRRPVSRDELKKVITRFENSSGDDLLAALKFELRTVLMSPAFLYRGFLIDGERGTPLEVDDYELAERLSYFLWADMPDSQLMSRADDSTLSKPNVLSDELDRMLASPKSRSLAEIFAAEWLTLSEIDLASDNPPIREALKSQPIDFMHYLFTNDRPLIEMIQSKVSFINPHTSRMYRSDAKQMQKYVRKKGIEVEIVRNQQIEIQAATERGGVLTMPGILAMNRGPILRGTWVLERILGEHLPDPPANVGQVDGNKPGQHLTFRQRFEQHRDNQACAVCHDKIDPLGFSLQAFDDNGQYRLAENYKPKKRKSAKESTLEDPKKIDTSGQLPSGERFQNAEELKQVLTTSQREAVIRNMVRRTLSYAVCRKLELFDQPTIETITQRMIETNGTWRDLFHEIAISLPFRQTLLSEQE